MKEKCAQSVHKVRTDESDVATHRHTHLAAHKVTHAACNFCRALRVDDLDSVDHITKMCVSEPKNSHSRAIGSNAYAIVDIEITHLSNRRIFPFAQLPIVPRRPTEWRKSAQLSTTWSMFNFAYRFAAEYCLKERALCP